MLPDRVSNPGPLTYESGALLTALFGPAKALLTLYRNKDSWTEASRRSYRIGSAIRQDFPLSRLTTNN